MLLLAVLRGGHQFEPLRHFDLVGVHAIEQISRRRLEEASCELVQQPAHFIGHVVEQTRVVGAPAAKRLRMHERVFKLARQGRQVGKANGRRAARQRMRQRDRDLAHRSLKLQRPFGQLVAQPTRQFVGLVQVNIEQRDADLQGADHLHLFVVGLLRRRRLEAVFGLGLARLRLCPGTEPAGILGWRGGVRGRQGLQGFGPCPGFDRRLLGLETQRLGGRHAFVENFVGRSLFKVWRGRHGGTQRLDRQRMPHRRASLGFGHVELERRDGRLGEQAGFGGFGGRQLHGHREGHLEILRARAAVHQLDRLDRRLELRALEGLGRQRVLGGIECLEVQRIEFWRCDFIEGALRLANGELGGTLGGLERGHAVVGADGFRQATDIAQVEAEIELQDRLESRGVGHGLALGRGRGLDHRRLCIRCARLVHGQHEGDRCRGRGGRIRAGALEAQETPGDAQRIGNAAQRRALPAGGVAGGDRFHPAREEVERFVGGLQQLGGGGLLGRQCGVVELLARPGRIAELAQAEHARAALEGVEGTP